METEAINEIDKALEGNVEFVIVNLKDTIYLDIDGIAVLEAITKHCKKKDIIVSFVCLSEVQGFGMISKSQYFKANLAQTMIDNGPYTNETYNLEPIKETMRNIGFNVAYKVEA